jgi:hypothetical protein
MIDSWMPGSQTKAKNLFTSIICYMPEKRQGWWLMKQGIAQVAHFPHLNMNGCVCEARAHARASQTHPFMCRRSQIASPEKGKSDL